MRSVIVHGHFYQPPRENPWREAVDAEPSAAPFHDWNARITSECYEPYGAARILDGAGQVAERLNLYEWTSFDVGATLLLWLERNAPAVHATILDADRASAQRLAGHGNAFAAPFHHVILPLASRRDKVAEIRWGLDDFRRRFGRESEGLWLPETAVDEETLVVAAEAGARFTVLAPRQVENPPSDGAALRFAAGGGREIALFAYDGGIASDVAFGPLLQDGERFAARLAPVRAAGRGSLGGGGGAPAECLTSLAVDGETFGHHKKFAEMALAGAVKRLRGRADVRVENYASFLARTPARTPARLVEPSSWSCAHGIERWRSNCVCGATPGTSHVWRRPLRAALNWLARELDARFEVRGGPVFGNAWSAREAFGAVAALPQADRLGFVSRLVHDHRAANEALRLLDGARARLGMFGSCAWFFDDAAGHETILMLRLAAYAIDLLGDDGVEREFLSYLALADSAGPGFGDAAEAYRALVLPLRTRPAA